MTPERAYQVRGGWPMLWFNLALFFGGIALFIASILAWQGIQSQTAHRPLERKTGRKPPLAVVEQSPVESETRDNLLPAAMTIGGLLSVLCGFVCLFGHFTLQPNTARVLILFGAYKGTVRESGFWWTNPFMTKMPISLRTRNFEGARLKVNDKNGNPIEIAAVVVWRVENTAEAMFDVDNFEDFVKVQSETAVRHLANSYAYDHGEEGEITLRSGVDEVSHFLQRELQERLSRAGVVVEETRLTHLAYAPEIAGAMLRRQQAEAIIAARQKIVHGAVSMVEMALSELDQKQVVDLDNERKASMVSNLLVVLCGETEAQPVINTGTLYTQGALQPNRQPRRAAVVPVHS